MRTGHTLVISILVVVLASCRQDESPTAADPASTQQAAPTGSPASQSAASGPAKEWHSTRWCVIGQVRDESGAALAGVEVTAHCGIGTLRRTGHAVTDADGNYVLRFGFGMMFRNDHSGLQAATIAPHKAGMVEQNLHRQGDLRMAKRLPDEAELRHWGRSEAIVYPEQPRRVDFVMVPAATISGRLLDSSGPAIAKHRVSVDAEELPPSSSVLATMKTDETGRFRFTEVPAGPVWLTMRSPENVMREVRTETMHCEAAHVYELELVYHPGPPPRLTMRHVTEP